LTRRGPRTSTRRCTSSAPARATACAYAIADVPALVKPGGALDIEAFTRGQTIYAPDRWTPLYPERLSEDAASLLPHQVRPAFVWDMHLDSDGEGTSVDVYRAMVSSKSRLDYAEVQRAVDSGTADERLNLLKEVGERRIILERARGGASLPMPEQEVKVDEDGNYAVAFRPPMAAGGVERPDLAADRDGCR